MSDTHGYNPEEHLKAVIEAANKPRMDTGELKTHMRILYRQAKAHEDTARAKVIANTWGLIQSLDNHYDAALGLLKEGLVASVNLVKWKDSIEYVYHDLLDNLRNLNEQDTEVREALDCARDAHEREMESAGGMWEGDVAWAVRHHGMLYVGDEQARRFIELVLGRHVPHEGVISDDLRMELSTFIVDWLERAEADLAEDKRHSTNSKKRPKGRERRAS